MKVFVTGSKGQLGYDCIRELNRRGYRDVLGVDIDELDITDEKAVHSTIKNFNPDAIIHCASWTAVDKAEECPDIVKKVNVLGTKYLCEAAAVVGAKFVYISTDYVFSNDSDFYRKTSDKTNPLSIYGLTKLGGEVETSKYPKHFIIRISWAFGINGNNFVKTMLKLGETHKELSVVCDQIGSPTYTYDLSKLLCDMIETDKYGVYHATNEGICSWADFAKEIFKQSKMDVKVNPITTEEYLKNKPQQAKRPLNSRLSKKSLDEAGFKRLPTWQDATIRFLKELNK